MKKERPINISHKELIKHAKNWVWKRERCKIVITEMVTQAGEVPDIIGWQNGYNSVLIECKISVTDLRADSKKTFRMFKETGIGNFRYYCFPERLYDILTDKYVLDKIPIEWGIIILTDNNKIRQKRPALYLEADKRKETNILISAMRRIGKDIPEGKGISVDYYLFESKNTASLGIENEDE